MRTSLRAVAVLATAAVVTSTLASPAAAAPVHRGADWLQTQLSDGIVVNETFEPDYRDYGLTADVALAFAEAGQTERLQAVSEALAAEVNSYTTGADFGAPDDVYVNATAKLAVVAQVAGADPRAYGGADLVQRLHRQVSTRTPTVGRIQDKSDFGDFANVIGQSFAARALARAGSGRADEAIAFLLQQQCAEGYFRLNLSRPSRADQSCDAARADNAAPDTDVTALAVLSLRALPKPYRSRATRRALDNGVDWLVGAQRANGSFGGGVATETSNTNSTGLAAWALGDSGACRVAKSAAQWVRALQVSGDTTGTPLEGEDGAIAYDQAALTTATADGITDGARDQWRRATAQAAPGLAYVRGC